MSMSANLHGAKIARHVSISGGIDALVFETSDVDYINIFLPRHVAAAMAAAFNAAMAEQDKTEGTLA